MSSVGKRARAASWTPGGSAAALGRLHRSGIGVERDAVQAYVWFNRAAALLNMDGVQERDNIAVKLGADELRRAQALSLEAAEATARQERAGSR